MKKPNGCKRALAGVLAVLTVAGFLPANMPRLLKEGIGITAEAVESWESGGCTVTLNEEGILTVRKKPDGDGAMADYVPERPAEWYNMHNSIREIMVEEGVTAIGNHAFRDCFSLESVALPEGVKTIGEAAFQNCSVLESVNFPEGLEAIGDNAFSACMRLTGLTFPDGLKTIGKSAFNDCKAITRVALPEGMETISEMTFANCDAMTYALIPSTVTKIEASAFSGCISVTNVYCYGEAANLTWNGYSSSFRDKTRIHVKSSELSAYQEKFPTERFIFDAGLPEWESDDCLVSYYHNGTLIVSPKPGGNGMMTDSFGLMPGWYNYRDAIKKIVVKPGVTMIGGFAFYSCSQAVSVELPKDLKTIGNYAFEGCRSLTNVTFPEGLTTIGDLAFNACTALTSISFSDGLETIGNNAFSNCSALTSVTFPEELGTIDSAAFYNCSSLTDLVLPEGLENIGKGAFKSCSSLERVVIPSSVTEIGSSAFQLCDSVTDVYCFADAANLTWGNTKYDFKANKGTVCHVKSSQLAAFQEKFTDANVTFVGDDLFAADVTMNPLTFAIECVKVDDNTLISGTDYSVTYMQGETVLNALPETPGDYTVVITGQGSYSGSYTKDFTVSADAIAARPVQAQIEALPDLITAADSDEITAARAAYDALTDAQKSALGAETLAKLTATETLLTFVTASQPKDVTNYIGYYNAVFTVEEVDGVSYQWQFLNGASGWKDSGMDGAKTNKLRVPITVERDNQKYRCAVSLNGKTAYSPAAAIHANATITSESEFRLYKIGETAKFSITAVGTGLTYQWQFNDKGVWKNSGMTGAQTATLSVPVTAAREGQLYRCIVTSANGTSDESDLFAIIIKPEITAQPTAQVLPIGQTAKFTVSTTSKYVWYQWQFLNGASGWQDSGMEGAQTATLSVPVTAARDGQQYRCIITSLGDGSTLTTNAAAIKIPPMISTQPQNASGKIGETAKFTVAASGKNLKYQWQFLDNGAWRNSGMTGAQTATLSVPVTAARDGQQYRCIVTSTNGTSATSNAAKLIAGVTITAQPKDYTGNVGDTAKFTVTATGKNLTYQWQFNDNGVWKNSGMTGAQTATLSVPVTTARNGQKYRCIVKAANGTSATSNAATLKMSAGITGQPQNAVGKVGDTVKFTVSASNATYQWQFLSTAGWKDSGMTGAKTSTISVPVTEARDGQKYRCIVKFADGSIKTSSEASLKVQAAITAQPQNASGKVGETAKFTVTASGTNLTYQWQFLSTAGWKDSGMTGAKTATISVPITAARNGQQYRCIVTSANGTTVTSDAAALMVKG